MIRRRFLFWIGFGLFGLGEKVRAGGLDELAAAIMRSTEPSATVAPPAAPEHWTATGNRTWRWFERENLVDGQWRLTGITTPIHRKTGQPYTEQTGYLDDSLVPAEMRVVDRDGHADAAVEAGVEHDPGHPDPSRRARHGRPPSKWLRSLHADELRIWLRSIDPPEAGVSGMTFFEHLTRDHSFNPDNITGLTIDEQAKLHAAAHDGY
jgi:hypothetical protein